MSDESRPQTPPAGYHTGHKPGWTRQDQAYQVEGMMQMYPYGASIGFGCQPVILFHGEEYVAVNEGLPVGCGVAFGFNLGHAIGHFVSNTVKSAGRAVGHVTRPIQDFGGKITHAVSRIPLVGAPLHTIMDVAYHQSMGLVNTTVAIAHGKRLDRAVMDHLKVELQDFKQVGPYMQTIAHLVPIAGDGVSGCLAAGLALAQGQPIGEILKAGALSAVPGGAMVQAALRTGVETIQHVAKGDKLNLGSLTPALNAVTGGLQLPPVARDAIVAGIATAGHIAQGKPLDKALTDAAIHGLPIPESVKRAMTDASALTLELANGRRVDQAFTHRLNGVMGALPVHSPLRSNIQTALSNTVRHGQNVEQVMAASLQSGIADELLGHGAAHLSPAARKALKTGIALGSGTLHQGAIAHQLETVIPGKLTESGIQVAKTSPMFNEARKLAAGKNGVRGFDLGTGLLSQEVGLFHVAAARNFLKNPADKMGFDMAAAARIGAVSHPKPPSLSAAAHAGHAITLGMQTYVPNRKTAIMSILQSHPSAGAGASLAMKQVALNREGFIPRVLRALRLKHGPVSV